MRIGNLSLENNVLLAPMAGITNLPFRLLLRDFGCAFACTEMISVNGLVRESAKSMQYLLSSPTQYYILPTCQTLFPLAGDSPIPSARA